MTFVENTEIKQREGEDLNNFQAIFIHHKTAKRGLNRVLPHLLQVMFNKNPLLLDGKSDILLVLL